MQDQDTVVYIDMDGTLFDFDGAALRDIPLKDRVQRSSFYVIEDYPEDLRPLIEAVYNEPSFFENLEPMPGVVSTWKALLDNGYHPIILSAPLSSNPASIQGKIASLEKILVPHFGRSVVQEAIFDKHKWRYRGLALIDDRPQLVKSVPGEESATWEHILFGWPHYATVPLTTAPFRLVDWSNPRELLDILDHIKSSR